MHGMDSEMASLVEYYSLACFFLLIKFSASVQREMVKTLIGKSRLVEHKKGDILYAWDSQPEQ